MDDRIDKTPESVRVLFADDEPAILEAYRGTLASPTNARTRSDALDQISAAVLCREAALLNRDSAALRDTPLEWEVTCCTQGDEALAAARTAAAENRPFAVAFIDMHMPPGPDGLWTAQQLRALYPDLNLVMVSGSAEIDLSAIGRQVPPPDKLIYLQKPCHCDEIRQLAAACGVRWRTERQLRSTLAQLETLVERRTEDLRKALKAAQAADEVKRQFLAIMNHELRTPMNGIIGTTQLLMTTQLNEEQRTYIDSTYRCSLSLLALLDDILDYVKINTGTLDLNCTNFDLGGLCQALERVFKRRCNKKGLSWKLTIGPDVPATVKGDLLRLRQVLMNLISNALKFTERGGIEVTVELKKHSGRRTMLQFAVADTGIGIPPEKHTAIFEPFMLVDASTTRGHGGSGLGLAFSKSVVERMGGRIEMESRPAKGSTFRVLLPLAQAAETAQEAPEAPGEKSGATATG